MYNELDFFTLKSKIFQLDSDINDDMILSVLNNHLEGQEDKKLDIVVFIKNLVFPNSANTNFEEINSFVSDLFNQLLRLSTCEYSLDEQLILREYLFYNITDTSILTKEQISLSLDNLRRDLKIDVGNIVGIWYAKEQLRLTLLRLLNSFGDLFLTNFEEFNAHLTIASRNAEEVREIADVIDSL